MLDREGAVLPELTAEAFLESSTLAKQLAAMDKGALGHVAKFFDQIFKIALYRDLSKGYTVIDNAQFALKYSAPKYQSFVAKNTAITDLLLDHIDHFHETPLDEQRLYFSVLTTYSTDSKKNIQRGFAKESFFHSLVAQCENDFVYGYLAPLFKTQSSQFVALFYEFGLAKLLARQASGSLHSREFIKLCFMGEMEREMISAVLDYSELTDPEFLFFLHQTGLRFPKSTEWKQLLDRIEPLAPDFCKEALKQPEFTAEKRAMVFFVFSVVYNHKRLGTEEHELLQSLVNDFFVYPTNTFLHSCVHEAIKLLNKRKILNRELCQQLRLHERIITAYKDTETLTNYTAHLREISVIIHSYVPSALSNEWNHIVVARNKAEFKIIKKGYGSKKYTTADWIVLVICSTLAISAIAVFFHLNGFK